jgi:hypothetical protein
MARAEVDGPMEVKEARNMMNGSGWYALPIT